MSSELERALINFVQTLTLLAEDLHVTVVTEESGYEAGQHLRSAYDAGRERPKKKTTRRKGVRGN